jgi:hypothetical protein
VGWRFSYRRWLTPDLIIQEAGLLQLLNQVRLTQENDSPRWKWLKNGKFTVKSVYKHVCRNGMDRSFRHLWKSKIPLKIKVWLWLIWHNPLLPKRICLNVIGQGTHSVNSVVSKNPSTICSLVVQLPSSSGVLLPLPSTLPLVRGAFHNFLVVSPIYPCKP